MPAKQFELMVPDDAGGHGVGEGLLVTALKPVHPLDDLTVALNADTLLCIIRFVRRSGLSLECLTQKRAYNQNAGYWRQAGKRALVAHRPYLLRGSVAFTSLN